MKRKTVYFLGIGGIGMSALAYYFKSQGYNVSGYDLTPSPITDQLVRDGIPVYFSEDTSLLPCSVDFVVYTPAVSKEHAAYQYFIKNNIPIYKRAEVLGMITKEHPCIAVAGTHGKTTSTALISHLLYPEREIMAFIGGISKNLNSNFITSPDFETAVVEADEFDRSFLHLFPTTAIITSIDADHLDIYGQKETLAENFQLFAKQIREDGTLIIHESIINEIIHPQKVSYGFSPTSDYFADNISHFPNRILFDLHTPERSYEKVELGIGGSHNLLNALGAVAAIISEYKRRNIVLNSEQLVSKLSSFQGVKRRFDYIAFREDFIYIDDYAHHPEEISAFLKSIRQIFPCKKITVIFQPHLYSRTRDFALQFAESLALADQIILLDIYPAREKPIEGVTSEWLLSLIDKDEKQLLRKEDVAQFVRENRPELLVTLGAGDIDRIVNSIG
ncbi:UDP-N-acetylmuramate--L-alanine ligase [Bacteroidales bacterium OttesenSCG-928-B11]|nr:UDP-N-acetylmuramate--L-alanine ligase [Bacteroidales bacterium OttesenSCG-928-E04]MDL2308935.1 UDP-N-acetylmuramate--L-alanine ligase [Bacteroidales bacterium OttesenSCG-928-C03]MDL2312706.1 UDP-N-acetylmuramate--L-alanine ligase [Bacteroidales bacterium OttesenSCG-928-B11]MDL2326266.1 UDP-N-acetylmuramate--L-alanine ligase [Bacteroidales bacterium OttesenSCG-928-A14]